MELDEDDYTLCDCCGSYAQSTADDDGEGNPLGHVQCEQCSRIAELESKLDGFLERIRHSRTLLDSVDEDPDTERKEAVLTILRYIETGTTAVPK